MLTKRQKQILNYIKKFIQKNEYAPSLEEIKEHFNLKSVSTIHQHIEALKTKGYLNKLAHQHRTIELIKNRQKDNLIDIPLLGTIAAGQPIEAIEDKETITMSEAQLPKSGEFFALRVQGDSMIEEGIFDEDTVIIRKQSTAENGDTVVALIDGNEATLKKIYKEKNKFRLQPANPKMKPIFVKELIIQGKVISVLRNFGNQIKIEQISKKEKYIVSKEYSGQKSNFKEIIEALVKFRDILLFKNGFYAKNEFLKTQIIDVLILQEAFKHIATTKKIDYNKPNIKLILEQLRPNTIKLDKNDLKLLDDILKKYDFTDCDDDILGFIYQSIRPQGDRKDEGQYYTPEKVVKYILDKVNINLTKNKNLKILDPACGTGQFLLRAYDILYKQYKKTKVEENKIHQNIIKNHLFGFDIDQIAVVLTKLNLFLKSKGHYNGEFNILLADTLKRDSNLLELNPLNKFNHFFDFIIGNPPWGANLSKKQKNYYKKYYEIGRNGLNTFTLFIERCFDFLKDGAKLGFLVPEAYLKIKVHQLSRKQLLNRTKILLLAIGGKIFQGVYAPSLVLVFQKEKNSQKRDSNKIIIENNIFNGDIEKKKILQNNFHKYPENIFNINQIGKIDKILNHILSQKNYYLENNALFILGIVTGDNKKHLMTKKENNRYSPIVVGKDIAKYKINFTNHYFIYDKNVLQQAGPKEYYTVPEKIIYKFIGAKLAFAYDNQQRFTLNNANAFVPRIEKLKTKYVLALLNSKVLQFFYGKSFFTVRVLRGNLEKLPLVYATPNEQNKITKIVDEIIDSKRAEEIENKMKQLDEKIFDLYNIKKEWRDYIISESN